MNRNMTRIVSASAGIALFVVLVSTVVFVSPSLTHAQEDDSLGYGWTGDDNLGYGWTDDNLGYGWTGDDNLGYGWTDDSYNDTYEDTYYQDGVGYSYSPSSSYSTPRYSPPPSSPVRVSNPSYPSYPTYASYPQHQQQQQQMGPTTITSNTCGNTSVSTIAQVTPVYRTPVHYPVQYVFPQPIYPTYPTYDYCPNLPGVQTALPAGYYLQNGYCYQQAQPYVALSQIPYTGFDFGAAGNSIYSGALLSFALASSYLVLFYKGGAATFMGAMIPLRRGRSERISAKAVRVDTV